MKNVLLPAKTSSYTWHMKVFKDIHSSRKAIKGIRQSNRSIGLVPTMGALHDGHLTLINAANKENDVTIATIFVNPIQFNNPDDLKNYPSTYDDDLAILEKTGCDIVFAPSVEEMYPQEPIINLSFGNLADIMEGAFRPGHFSGVALIVIKLFNILQPTRAYFGQKDLQQYKIIEQMVYDASLEVALKMMPIMREKSGLALSSRNNRLTETGRGLAAQIYAALNLAGNSIKNGGSIKASIAIAEDHLRQFPDIKVEYLTLVNLKDLQVVETTNGSNQLVLCFAGHVDQIRLIDNLIINGFGEGEYED
jgi:pantoate--beta-alanine ligase